MKYTSRNIILGLGLVYWGIGNYAAVGALQRAAKPSGIDMLISAHQYATGALRKRCACFRAISARSDIVYQATQQAAEGKGQTLATTMSRKCREQVTDVVTWHDIDLDYVLGDYTESENEINVAASAVSFPASGSSSDGEDPGKENKPTSTSSGKPEDIRGVFYKCPVCEKSLRSISGFRGHVMKQHGRADLKGNNFKIWSLYV